MDTQEIANILKEFQDVLGLTDWFSAAGRSIVWWVDKMFANIVGSLTKGLDYAYEFLDFYNSTKINDFIDDYKGIFFSLMTLAIAYLGFQIIRGNKELNKIVSSTLFAISLFVALPWLLGQGTDLLMAGKDALPNNKHQALTIIQENITDVYAIDAEGWTTKNPEPRNEIANMTDVNLLDINESVDMGGFFIDDSPLSDKGQDVLSKKLTKIDGKYVVTKPVSHFFTEDQTYYRYSFHPFLMLFQLVGKALVLGFTIAKTMMMLTSLGILKVITVGTALTDLETGQRNKKLLLKIRNTLIVLYIMLVMLYMYDITMAFVSASEMSSFMKAFAIIVLSIMFMDGPDIVEELFGIDAGLKSVSRGLIGFAMGAKTATDLAKGGADLSKKVAKTAGGVANKTATAGGMLIGGAKGALDGFKERATQGMNVGGGSSNESPLAGQNEATTAATSAAKDTASGGTGSTGGAGGIASSESPSTPGSGGITSLGGESNLPSDSPNVTPSPGLAQQVENSNKNFATRPPGNNTEGLLKGHTSPQKEPPSVAYGTMPKGAASARENMLQYASGREKDPQSIPEKALSTYANTAQKAYDSNIAKKTRKSYDVMKNTTKGGQS
ncbi:pLS20_p028 family conjugation system transmembrane protein [Listeria monocytogenes]